MDHTYRRIKDWLSREGRPQPPFSPEEFLRSLSLIVGLDQLLENFSAKLTEMSGASALYLTLFEPITDRYVGKMAKGNKPELLAEFSFSRSDNLIKWLTVNRSALDVLQQTEVLPFLSHREQELLSKTFTRLVVPLIIVNRLTGALFLGQKLDGSAYSQAEIGTISMLASQTALAIEHALIYQFQEDRLKKLFHSDRLATIGELAAGAAHEIRNPLTSIRSTIQFLQKDLPGEKRPLVDGIIEEVDRIDQIIEGLLSFSKSSELHFSTVDLGDVLDQTLLLLEPKLREQGIEVQKRFHLPVPPIPGDASQLKQVFLNILLNSVEALPAGGRITIELGDSVGHTGLSQGSDYASVAISDTGPGIPEADLTRVFDPFYTTKEAGTGLGLSISYGIVSKHGGEIQIQSPAEGTEGGTAVLVRLPRQSRVHKVPQG
jgi:signal transduction histidine kinase